MAVGETPTSDAMRRMVASAKPSSMNRRFAASRISPRREAPWPRGLRARMGRVSLVDVIYYLCLPMSQKATAKRLSARTLVCTATCLATAVLAMPGFIQRAWGAPGSAGGESCFTTLAATRNFSLGRPTHAVPTPDGKSVLYLRSGPRDTKLGLFEYDLDAQGERALAKPDAGPANLSVEEKARREHALMTLTGITDFALSHDGKTVLVSQADELSTISLPGSEVHKVAGSGWIAPRLAPDGTAIAAVRDNDVHVVDLASGADKQLTTGGTDVVTHGLPEFAAAEELERLDGVWWSPDSTKL